MTTQKVTTIIAECKFCKSATICDEISHVGEHIPNLPSEPPEDYVMRLVRCRECSTIMLVSQEVLGEYRGEEVLGSVIRLYPAEDYVAPRKSPADVRWALSEAFRCFKARAFTATALMCGRCLEAICADQKAQGKDLFQKLKDMHERGLIDAMIYEWTVSLRKARNIGAHDSSERFHEQDADDLLQFSIAICDYIYRLSAKHREFKSRLAAKTSKKANA